MIVVVTPAFVFFTTLVLFLFLALTWIALANIWESWKRRKR